MPVRVSRGEFLRLAEETLASLPEEFKQYFKNISVAVEDMPTDDDAESTGVPREELLGLFRGVSYGEQGGLLDIPPPLPDEIILFQKNIEEICESPEELADEIRMTLIHEVGHYFGMSEEDLQEYED